uniref:Uncharacterized protein n=1 Tax=Anguilla anguilla TaxID=7936 RepID=A0A0E9VNX8_ANGAN
MIQRLPSSHKLAQFMSLKLELRFPVKYSCFVYFSW